MLSTQARTLSFHKFHPQPTKNRQLCCQGSLRVSLDVLDSFRLHQHRQLKPMPISQNVLVLVPTYFNYVYFHKQKKSSSPTCSLTVAQPQNIKYKHQPKKNLNTTLIRKLKLTTLVRCFFSWPLHCWVLTQRLGTELRLSSTRSPSSP